MPAEEMVNSVGMVMIDLPPGRFMMGSPLQEEGRRRNEVLREVTFTHSSRIAATAVTLGQWFEIMGTSLEYQQSGAEAGAGAGTGDDHPMCFVSWEDALRFCDQLTQREREHGLIDLTQAYALPSEAQWEYACRAGTTDAFAGNLERMGWYEGNSEGTSHQVGQLEPNTWGMKDMHGNVWEWCADWFSDKGAEVPEDPTGSKGSMLRVVRGGSWDSPAEHCRSAFRIGREPSSRNACIGFRPVLAQVEQRAEMEPEGLSFRRSRVQAGESLPPEKGKEPEKASPSQYPPENVQFTTYRPARISPDRWSKLLVYTHLDEKPEGAPPEEPRPIEVVRKRAEKALEDEPGGFERFEDITKDSRIAIPRETDITFAPCVPGVQFNPGQRSFRWSEGLANHEETFLVRPSMPLQAGEATGSMTVFLGSLILAEIPLKFQLVKKLDFEEKPEPTKPALPYRRIFPSHSHDDIEVVKQFEHWVSAYGDRFYRDVLELRAGEEWWPGLKDLIRQADVFQLFWSANSSKSKWVGEEWRYAMSLNRAHFIRPVFWEDPCPEKPDDLQKIQWVCIGQPVQSSGTTRRTGRTDSLHQVEELIRRLREGMVEKAANIEKLHSLAGQYADLCRTANERLRCCSELLSRVFDCGDRALRVATSPPDLLDLCEVLAELQTGEWRQFCRENYLPMADSLNQSAKQQLDRLCEQKENFVPKLVREYSAALSKRDSREALNVARQILRLNSLDKTMAAAIEGLETGCVGEVLGKLEVPMLRGDQETILALLTEIDEIAPGRIPRSGELLLVEALEMRKSIRRAEALETSKSLIQEALFAKDRNDPTAVLRNVSRVDSIKREHDFVLESNDCESLCSLEEWGRNKVRLLKVEDDSRKAIQNLKHTLSIIYEKQWQCDYSEPSLDELRQDASEIQNRLRAIAEYEKGIDPALQGQAGELLDVIQRKIFRLKCAKRNRRFARTLGLIALGVVSFFGFEVYEANDEAKTLAELISGEKALELEWRIGNLEEDPPLWMILGKRPAEVEAGKSWIEREKAEASDLEGVIAEIERELRENAKPEDLDGAELLLLKIKAASATEALARVIEDYRSDLEHRLDRVESRLQRIVDQKRSLADDRFRKGVSQLRGKIKDKSPPEISKDVNEIKELIEDLEELANPEIPELKPSDVDVLEFEALKHSFATLKNEAVQ